MMAPRTTRRVILATTGPIEQLDMVAIGPCDSTADTIDARLMVERAGGLVDVVQLVPTAGWPPAAVNPCVCGQPATLPNGQCTSCSLARVPVAGVEGGPAWRVVVTEVVYELSVDTDREHAERIARHIAESPEHRDAVIAGRLRVEVVNVDQAVEAVTR